LALGIAGDGDDDDDKTFIEQLLYARHWALHY